VKTGRRYRAAGFAGFALAGLFVAMAACSNQGEGDRCDFDNGNDDCQDGLVCVPKTPQTGRGSNAGVVNPPYNNADRCCPLDRSQATHPACTQNTTSTVADGQAPADTGPPQEASVDAASDAAGDGGDAAADADSGALDASDDG
jgi:hypothetical protein